MLFVQFRQIAEVGNAYHEFRLIVLSLQNVPQVFNLGFKRADHHFVCLALFNQLRVVIIAQANLVAFVGKIGNIGVVIFTQQQLACVFEVFNVLIPHLGCIEDGRQRIDCGVKAAVPDIFNIDDALYVFADIELIKGFRIDFRPQVGNAFHQFFGNGCIAFAFGIFNIIIGDAGNLFDFIEDNFAVGQLFFSFIDELVFYPFDFFIDEVCKVIGN